MKTKIDSLTWQDVFAWCLAHGALNDQIRSIEIKGGAEVPVLVMEGHEDMTVCVDRHDAAVWRREVPLRSFP